MKKLAIFIITIIMLLSCVISVSAATTTCTINAGSVEAVAGEQIVVPITISKNSGFVSLSLKVTYDTSVLTLISVNDTGLIKGEQYHSAKYDSPYKLNWVNDISTTNTTKTGKIVELIFIVNDNAQNGKYSINISMDADDALDANGNSVSFAMNAGYVTVVKEEHTCSFGDWEEYSSKKHIRYCDGCDNKETASHNLDDGKVTVKPAHGVEGEMTYTCEDCGYTKTETIDAEEHSYSAWKKVDDNQHKRSCACGYVETEDHNWDAGVTVANVTTYTCEDCKATKTKTEGIPVTGITLSETSLSLNTTDDFKMIEATIYPSNATNQKLVWESDNSDVARVAYMTSAPKAKIYPVAPGTATITVTTYDGNFVAQCVVTVTEHIPATGITLNKEKVTLTVGDSEMVQAIIAPANATNKKITWKSSNDKVISFRTTADGVYADITALAAGTATITATTEDGKYSASCVVTVTKDYSYGLAYVSNGNGTCYVSGIGTCTDTEIVIPSEYNGMSVVSIGGYAFENNEKITSVVIPNSVRSIGDFAFRGCTALAEITIPNGVTKIGLHAFRLCTSLAKITIPNSVTKISYSAFYKCTSLAEITIPNSVTEIEGHAFSNCTSLAEITIPNSVTKIGTEAFACCTSLTEITISNSVTEIGFGAFYECTSLAEITIPNSVTEIGSQVFRCCTSLAEITIPNNVTKIGSSTFYECTSLAEITIPGSVKEIGSNAFSQCSSLKDVYYCGTEAQWNLIKGIKDQSLYTATIHYLGNDNPEPNASEIIVDSVSCSAGKTVEVKIALKNNPGIASMKLKVAYDQSVLSLQSIKYNDQIGGQSQQPQNMASPVTLNWYNGGANSEGDFVYATLTFLVNKNAKAGKSDITVTYNPDDVYNIDYENIAFIIQNGSVEIVDHTPGDISGDGKVNNKDLSLLFQHLSDWDVTVNEAALDVNGDGKVNNKDLSLLFQYLSDWDVTIY